MIALNRIFQTGKGLFQLSSRMENEADGLEESHVRTTVFPSPALRASQLCVDPHFGQTEIQLEDLIERLEERPLSRKSQSLSFAPSFSNFSRAGNSRHIDLLDGLHLSLPSQMSNMSNPRTASLATSPYNEDVAETNMARFLQMQYREIDAGSGMLPAIYQEDMAHTNGAKYVTPSRSSSPAPRNVYIPSSPKANHNPKKPSKAPEEDLRSRSPSPGQSFAASSQESQSVRSQKSAPSLSVEESAMSQLPKPIQYSGIPTTYELVYNWNDTPRPDSPTLPL